MGEVWLAWDDRLRRQVALKVLRGLARDDDRKLLDEARATAALAAPGLVEIHEVGACAGRGFIVLEYLCGGTLRDRMRQRLMGELEAMRIAAVLAEALAEAHAHGLVHRDLKPENVIFDRAGRPKVVDFGLARRESGEERGGEGSLDVPPARRLGTYAYMAPEVWQGESPSAAADLWALGLMLCEMITGHRPGQDLPLHELEEVVCGETPMALEGLPENALGALVRGCLARCPADRPGASAVATELRDLLARARPRSEPRPEPFIGLDAYGPGDAGSFSGRDEEAGELVERLSRQPAVVVVGQYGVGKSSLVAAGAVPRLREQGSLLVVRVRPGLTPLQRLVVAVVQQRQSLPSLAPVPFSGETERLANALQDDPGLLSVWLRELAQAADRRVLLFVDQLEEIIAGEHEPDPVRAYLEAVALAAVDPGAPVRAVLTLREDRQAGVARVEAVKELLRSSFYLAPPNRRTLVAALRDPVDAVGYRWDDPGFPEAFAARIAGEQAALCIVQVVGRALWARRDPARKVVSASDLARAGGLEGVLAAHADGVLAAMDPGLREAAELILVRLVTTKGVPGERSPDSSAMARRIVSTDVLLKGLAAAAEPALERLVAQRLVVQRSGRCELVHDALLLRWPHLRERVAVHHGDQQLLLDLGERATRWEELGRRPHDLLGAQELAGRAGQFPLDRAPDRVRRYLYASRRYLKRRRRRRLMGVGAAITVLGVASISMTTLWLEARQQTERALVEEARAGLGLVRLALDAGDLGLARKRLLRVAQVQDSAELRARAWRLEHVEQPFEASFPESVISVAHMDDGRWVAGTVMDKEVHAFSLTGDEHRHLTLELGGDALVGIPGGPEIAVGTPEPGVLSWNPVTDRRRRVIFPHGSAAALATTAEGDLLAALSRSGELSVRDRRSEQVIATASLDVDPRAAMAFTPEGDQLVVSSRQPPRLRWLDARTLREQAVRDLEVLGTPFSVAVGGSVVATGHPHGLHCLWSAPEQPPTCFSSGQDEVVYAIALSPDESLLASGGSEEAIRLWELDTRRRLETWPMDQGIVRSLAFHPHEPLLLASHGDHLRMLRLPGEPATFFYERDPVVKAFSVTPDLDLAVSTGEASREALVWRVEDRRLERVLPAHHPNAIMGAVAIHPGGEVVAVASILGERAVLTLWDLAGGEPVVRRPLPDPLLHRFSFVGHENRLVGCSVGQDGEGSLWVWDPTATEVPTGLPGHRGVCSDLCIDGGGTRLAVANQAGWLRLWDLGSGALLKFVAPSAWGAADFVACDETATAFASVDIDEEMLVAFGRDLREARRIGTAPGLASALALASDGSLLAVGSQEGEVEVLDLASGVVRWSDELPARIRGLFFSRNGASLLAWDDGTVQRWDVASGQRRYVGSVAPDPGPLPEGTTTGGEVDGHPIYGSDQGGILGRRAGPGPDLEPLSLESLPVAAATLVAQGPRGTALLGFADGRWGLWSLESGSRLLGGRMHGAVVAGGVEGEQMWLETELGHRETLDISVFTVPSAHLRQRIRPLG